MQAARSQPSRWIFHRAPTGFGKIVNEGWRGGRKTVIDSGTTGALRTGQPGRHQSDASTKGSSRIPSEDLICSAFRLA
jgi:hypothetical protein